MASLGQKLAEARNRKGISIREASDSTKIRGDYLTKFENDDFDVNLPSVYLRGFLTNYARYLDLDPEGILADFIALQPGAHSPPRKPLGTISTGGAMDERPPEDSSSSSPSQIGSEVVFPWVKVGLSLGGILFAALLIIVIAWQCTDNGAEPSGTTGSSVDEPGILDKTPASAEIGHEHVLKLIITEPIKLMIIKLDGEAIQPLHNLKTGDVRELNFKDSFGGYSSSLENVTVEVDGESINYQGEGPLKFSWPLETPKEN
tara:strand:- start:679 stop:1458 length:780 start_codon:yes stop_codon:yes gene_type:complete